MYLSIFMIPSWHYNLKTNQDFPLKTFMGIKALPYKLLKIHKLKKPENESKIKGNNYK